jgi:hypothetical protein
MDLASRTLGSSALMIFETVKFNGKPIDAAYRNAGRPGAPGMSRRPACRATTRALDAKKGRQA